MPITTTVSRGFDRFHECPIESFNFCVCLRMIRSNASVLDACRLCVVCEFARGELWAIIGNDVIWVTMLREDAI